MLLLAIGSLLHSMQVNGSRWQGPIDQNSYCPTDFPHALSTPNSSRFYILDLILNERFALIMSRDLYGGSIN
jgi:hypothetical protein